jgi:hypothetical protein
MVQLYTQGLDKTENFSRRNSKKCDPKNRTEKSGGHAVRTNDDVDDLVDSLVHERNAGRAPGRITNGVVDGSELLAIALGDNKIRGSGGGEADKGDESQSKGNLLHFIFRFHKETV